LLVLLIVLVQPALPINAPINQCGPETGSFNYVNLP